MNEFRAAYIFFAALEWRLRLARRFLPWAVRTDPGPVPRELTMTVTDSGEVIRFSIPPHLRKRAHRRAPMRSRVRFTDVTRAARRAMAG